MTQGSSPNSSSSSAIVGAGAGSGRVSPVILVKGCETKFDVCALCWEQVDHLRSPKCYDGPSRLIAIVIKGIAGYDTFVTRGD